jgi:hypothetical protein
MLFREMKCLTNPQSVTPPSPVIWPTTAVILLLCSMSDSDDAVWRPESVMKAVPLFGAVQSYFHPDSSAT